MENLVQQDQTKQQGEPSKSAVQDVEIVEVPAQVSEQKQNGELKQIIIKGLGIQPNGKTDSIDLHIPRKRQKRILSIPKIKTAKTKGNESVKDVSSDLSIQNGSTNDDSFVNKTGEQGSDEYSTNSSVDVSKDQNKECRFLPFTPQKRGRKKKNTLHTPGNDQDNIEESVTRRGTRKRKPIKYTTEDDENHASQDTEIEEVDIKRELSSDNAEFLECRSPLFNKSQKRRRRGRCKKSMETALDTDTSTLDEAIPNEKSAAVVCAVCKEEMPSSNWNYHKLRKHNNLTWKVGEPALDLNDLKFVTKTLNIIYRSKQPLRCDTCGQIKKSVAGLLSHKTVCSKPISEIKALRVTCEFCGKTVMPVSLTSHLKYCKGIDPALVEEPKENENTTQPVVIEKAKRKAAARAENIIQSSLEQENNTATTMQGWFTKKEFSLSSELLTRIKNDIQNYGIEHCDVPRCKFRSSDAVVFAQHYQTCVVNFDKELYVCRYCVCILKSRDLILSHVLSSHRIKKKTDEDYATLDKGEEDVNISTVEKKKTAQNIVRLTVGAIGFLLQNRYCSAATSVVYPPAYMWTMKFNEKYFSTPNLFPTWRVPINNLEELDLSLVHKYLPPLKHSANVNRITSTAFEDTIRVNHAWKKYKLFESEMWNNGCSSIFCGGQIFAMAWLPTPFDCNDANQMLAVATSSCDMDKLFNLGEVYCEMELIQFWNFGLLKNETKSTNAPTLEFCIAHDYGLVRCLEWCPSGCYDLETNSEYYRRLGILAVGCSNAVIYLYPVVTPLSGKIFKSKPVLKLTLESVLEEPVYGLEAHVTKISWSKSSGHEIIAAGYANGLVAIYKLNSASSLLKIQPDKDNVEGLMPYRVIKAHYHAVTALHIYHLNDGRRWLVSGSTDRSIKYWDLENPTVPISNFTKATITDGAWIDHWLSSVHALDDCCGSGPTTSVLYQPRNFTSEHTSTMYSNCHIWSIAGSEWTNGFAQGNVMGELQGYFPHQLFAGMDNDKTKPKKKAILSYVNLVEKDLSIQERIASSVMQKPAPAVNSVSDSLTDASGLDDVTKLIKAEPLTYKEASEKYGVVFCDINIKSFKECHTTMVNYIQSKSTKYYNPQPNIYPLQSINKVVFNPNHSSFLHLAAAYQIGFVRVSRLDFLKK